MRTTLVCSDCGDQVLNGVCDSCCIECSDNNEIIYNKLGAEYDKQHSQQESMALTSKSIIKRLEEENKKLKQELKTIKKNLEGVLGR